MENERIATFAEDSRSMWCSHCQQDVPATFARSAKGRTTCARCGRGVGLQTCSTSHSEIPAGAPSPATATKSPLDFSDWKLEDDLREAQRLVRLIQLQCDEPGAREIETASERDETLAAEPTRHRTTTESTSGGGSALGWLVSGSGLSGLVCGCALLVWSHYTGRVDLWSIGLPVALVSQAVLACGLILQCDFGGRKKAVVEAASHAPPAPATHLHVNAGGGMHASGLSVHFSATPQQQAVPTNSRSIKHQVEAALKRRAA
jgi:hypothetical protein